jgi:hypothetical protein
MDITTLAIVRGIKAGVEIQIGSFKVQTDHLGHPLQGFQTIRQQEYVRRINGSYWEWR